MSTITSIAGSDQPKNSRAVINTNFSNLNTDKLEALTLNAPEGILFNGKIVPSVGSNNLTVAIKGADGNDPSASNPVYCRINSVVRSITSALSVTKNAGTNWCNSGSAELATKEIDYFVYLGYNATDGVVVGFSRIPGANSYDDFSATSTNEKYCAISTITNAAATDYYHVIGRFAATLSAGAGYTWTVPTFTAKNLIQRPVYETRWLSWQPVYSASGSMTFGTVTTTTAKYKVHPAECKVRLNVSGTTGGSAAVAILMTTPFSGATGYAGSGVSVFDTTAVCGQAFMGYGDNYTYFAFLKSDLSNWGIGAGRGCYCGVISFEI